MRWLLVLVLSATIVTLVFTLPNIQHFSLLTQPTLIPLQQSLTPAPLTPAPNNSASCDIFFAIISGVTDRCKELRDAQRRSWLRPFWETKSPCYRFFIGTPTAQVMAEAALQRDLVILAGVEEVYHNLANKTLRMMAWTNENVHFSLLVKSDDDTYVVLSRLKNILATFMSKEFAWLGNCNSVYIPHRSGKWAVSREQFPQASGPPWTNGFLYVASSDCVAFYANKARDVSWPRLHLEDIDFALAMAEYGAQPTQMPGILGEGCASDMTATHYQDPAAMLMYATNEAQGTPLCTRVSSSLSNHE